MRAKNRINLSNQKYSYLSNISPTMILSYEYQVILTMK